MAEQSGQGMIMCFLDWEKAFDKVDQTRMMEALERLNIPDKVIGVIKALYKEPTFKVSMKDDKSEYKIQEAGIRQGCPLSPYLFILVMTVMFHDIYDRCSSKIFYGQIDGLAFAELLHADDTLLVLKNTRAINIRLAEI